jgi:hypothetical protein
LFWQLGGEKFALNFALQKMKWAACFAYFDKQNNRDTEEFFLSADTVNNSNNKKCDVHLINREKHTFVFFAYVCQYAY